MSMNRWPSPLPGPAWQSWRQAWEHIEDVTLQECSSEERCHILQEPEPLAVLEYMSRLASWGDVVKVQDAAQVWLTVVKQARAVMRELLAA